MSLSHSRFMQRTLAVLALAVVPGASLPACGDKPTKKPVAPPVAPQPPQSSGPVPSTESVSPSTRTLGGVELGVVTEPIRVAAQKLARDRKAGVAGLIAQGPAAHDAVLALLGSASLDEILGALEIVSAADDPAKVRPDAAKRVVPLLSHDAQIVRAAAAQAAELLDDPQLFIALVQATKPDAQRAGARLLGGWDGPTVEAALLPLLGDEALALDGALALSTPGKTASPAVLAAAQKAVAAEATPSSLRAGLTLLRRLGQPAARGRGRARALKSDDPALAVEGVRASAGALLAGLGADRASRCGARWPRRRRASRPARRARRWCEPWPRTPTTACAPRPRAALVKTGAGTSPAMDALLGDPREAVRRAAIAATATLPAPDATSHWRRASTPRPTTTKPFIMWALEGVPGRQAIDTLIAALTDKTVGGVAHIILQRRSGKDLPPEPAAWGDWADQQFAAPKPDAPQPAPDAPKAPDAPDAPKDAPPKDAPPKDAPKPSDAPGAGAPVELSACGGRRRAAA
ncbi:MAG: hypothetical protein U1F43_30850 [Myxococcota bacterium]